jgi:hypothetical protein
MGSHPSLRALLDFLSGRASRRRNRRVVRHLLNGCADCSVLTDGQPSTDPDATPSPRARAFDYTAAFAGMERAVAERSPALAAERAAAVEQLRQLAVQPFQRQRGMVAAHAGFRTWAFCELLLDTCEEWGRRNPARALQTARLGIDVAEGLERERYGEARVNDLRARAWARRADAERLLADVQAAEQSFARAQRLLKGGTGDPLEEALFLLLKASFLAHRRQFPAAFRLLDRVGRTARRYGDPHLAGQAQIARRAAISALLVLQKAAVVERITLGVVRELNDSRRASRSAASCRFPEPL